MVLGAMVEASIIERSRACDYYRFTIYGTRKSATRQP